MVSQEADFAAYAIPQRGRAWEGGGGRADAAPISIADPSPVRNPLQLVRE